MVATLIIPARETKAAREEVRRIAVADPLKMIMDDPDLDEAVRPAPKDGSRTARARAGWTSEVARLNARGWG